MNCHCARLCLISVMCALLVRHCGCDSDAQVKKTARQLVLPRVTCSARRLRAVFDPLVNSNMRVKDMTGAMLPVPESEGSCGVRQSREEGHNLTFFSSYDSCYARIQGTKVTVSLQVQLTGEDRWFRVNVSCPLKKRAGGRHREMSPLIQTPLPGNCDVETALRLECGDRDVSGDACDKLGCCYDARNSTCFHRLNACSQDGQFVFSVKATDTDPPVDPSSLVVKDQPECSPAAVTHDTAVFKMGVTDCDAKMKVDGDKVIYEVDLEEMQTEIRNKHSLFSLQVQCEYNATDLKGEVQLRSFHTATNPPPVVALGSIRVRMRIARDASFTDFVPEDQLPLSLPLGEAAYVEISIAPPPPDPTLSLRVRDCFAYPVSRHSVWTLLYDGCPNPMDDARSSVPVDAQGQTDSRSQVRRFDVKTFAFVDPHTGMRSKEEMFFYCWVEICTDDVDCAQSCAITSPENGRKRRDEGSGSGSDQVQLVSVGPLLLGQNATGPEDSAFVKRTKMFQVTVCVLSGVGAILLVILLFAVRSIIKKRQGPEARQDYQAQVEKEQSQ